MKIKRFEASSMSEALRQIKKEFGDEAVILSAKSIKKNRLLGKKKTDLVVVTAAIDKSPVGPASKRVESLDPSGAADSKDTGTDPAEKDSSLSILKRFNPITQTGQKKVKPKIVQLINDTGPKKQERFIYNLLISQGVNEDIAADMEIESAALLPEENISEQDYRTVLSQLLEACGVVGNVRKKDHTGPRIVVMLGPSGAGKTSAAAKMAARHIIQQQESVALVSLDNQRVAGTSELERFAQILKAPLRTASDVDELRCVLQKLSSFDLVVIDTPGMAATDQILCERVRRMVAVLDDPELYLLIGADLHEKAMTRIIGFFKSFGVQRLFFTRLDWAADLGPMINQAVSCDLPIAYVSDSPEVPEGLNTANTHDLAARLIPDTGGLQADEPLATVISRGQRGPEAKYYVANRNSDIFHLNDCKSVKRINTSNMVVFKDPAEAMGRRFKPCRMCCSELIFPKPVDRLARGFAAGNRYK